MSLLSAGLLDKREKDAWVSEDCERCRGVSGTGASGPVGRLVACKPLPAMCIRFRIGAVIAADINNEHPLLISLSQENGTLQPPADKEIEERYLSPSFKFE